MPELKLNTTTSIVDFLKSQGKASDFKSREKMFQESGLSDRLGPFIGSGSQNLALLKRLQTPTEAPAPTPEAPPVEAVPPQLQGVIPPGTSAADTLKTLGILEVPTTADLVNQVNESPAFKLFQEKQAQAASVQQGTAEAKKAGLESKFVGDQAKLENTLANKGLTFSGVKESAVQGLIDTLAASKLSVDRETANKLLSQNLDLKEEILKTTTKVIEDARKGRQDAIQALEKIGLTVIGDKIFPTLAAKSAELAQQRETRIAGEAGKEKGGQFTSTQINSGAANAEMSIKEFQKLSDDDKNFFINRGDELKSKKKLIDQAKVDNADPYEIQKEIDNSNAPDPAKHVLTNYLKKAFPGADTSKPKLPWWKKLFGITQ